LWIDTYKGFKRIGHGGSDAGYRTYTVIFPEKNLGIVVFGNISDLNPRLRAMEVADLFLEDDSKIKNETDKKIELSKESKSLILGKYFNNEGLFFDILDSSKLYVRNSGDIQEMIPITDTTFTTMDGRGIFKFKKGDYPLRYYFMDNEYLFQVREPFTLAPDLMKDYCGIFSNEEVQTQYDIFSKDGSLFLGHQKYGDVKLTPITINQFSSPHWWMNNLIFQRDSQGHITGFEINSNRVLHFLFKKINQTNN
jgi:hypothetical protein